MEWVRGWGEGKMDGSEMGWDGTEIRGYGEREGLKGMMYDV